MNGFDTGDLPTAASRTWRTADRIGTHLPNDVVPARHISDKIDMHVREFDKPLLVG